MRNFYGMDFYWMASSQMPKGVKLEPGFLTYKRTPVERKTEITFKKGKPVFLLDDPEGKVWVVKSFRDSYGQTYESLKDLGSLYRKLPPRLQVPGHYTRKGPGAPPPSGAFHGYARRV